MKGFWILILGLIIGIVVGYWLWHRHPAVNTTTIQVQTVGKSFFNPNQGDVLKWVDQNGQPFDVEFPFGNPCEGPAITSLCKVTASGGYFKYSCKTCLDPGVRVGSHGDLSNPGTGTTRQTPFGTEPANAANPPDPFVYCDAANKVAVQPVQAHVGDQIQWFPAGQVGSKNWQITAPAGACQEGIIFSPVAPGQPTKICTVEQQATYTVEADACQTKQGTGSISIVTSLK